MLIYCLVFLMLGSIIFGLSRVQFVYKKPIKIKKSLDIVVLIDISRSTKVLDVFLQENRVFRLDLIKEELRNFVEDYIGEDKNQMALIVFANKAMPRSYFTFHVGTLLFLIEHFDVEDFPPEGTDIGEAIKTSFETIDTVDNNPDIFNRPRHKRVFVLISDGEDTVEDELKLNEAIAECGRRRISVYTIGVGSREGGYIVEKIDESGNIIYMMDEDENGQRVFSKLEEGTLKRVAQASGGKYVRSKTGEELAMAFENALEREAEKEVKIKEEYQDIWKYLFGLSLIFCLLIIVLI